MRAGRLKKGGGSGRHELIKSEEQRPVLTGIPRVSTGTGGNLNGVHRKCFEEGEGERGGSAIPLNSM